MTIHFIIGVILGYLIGAIPFAVLVGKIFYNKDVRKEGSGNAGATNTFRVLGATAGIIVLILDILKGIAAVMLGLLFCPPFLIDCSGVTTLYCQLIFGLAAAIGHIFPVYLNFKGGKGVATFFGVILYLFPLVALVCVITFFTVFFITRYVSLSSMIASVAFTVSIFLLYLKGKGELPLIIFAVLIPVIICYTHRKNISRLLNGTETKMHFSKKENPS